MADDTLLIVGASGFLGRALCDATDTGWHRAPASRSGDGHVRLDLTQPDAVEAVVMDIRPRWVINAAAMTSVDGCELHPEEAHAVHVDGTRHLVRACEKAGCGLVFLSTNYVFDGQDGPYGESDVTRPLNVYGQSKLEGEALVLGAACPGIVVRTAVLYGYRPGCRVNFVTWAMGALARGESIRVVTDEWANPTYVDDLSAFLIAVCRTDFQGVVHFAGRDFLTRFEMVERLCAIFDFDTRHVSPITSAEFGQPARRPHRAGLRMDVALQLCDIHTGGFDENLRRLADRIPEPETLR